MKKGLMTNKDDLLIAVTVRDRSDGSRVYKIKTQGATNKDSPVTSISLNQNQFEALQELITKLPETPELAEGQTLTEAEILAGLT